MKGDDLHPQASFFVQLQRMFHLGFILVKDASLIGSISRKKSCSLRVQLYFGQFFSVSFLTASKNWWKYAHLSGFLAASKNWWKYAHPYSFLAASKNCPKWLLHGRRGGFFSSIYWKIKAFKHEWGVGSPYMPPTKPIGCSETIWSWIQYIWYECKRLHFGSS